VKKLMNNKGARTRLFFGATSGVITTIGLIVGLYSGTRSLAAVLGGMLVIAIVVVGILHAIGLWVNASFN